MNFVAIDVETANEGLASICQIGLVRFKSGEIVDKYTSLINPEDDFSPLNIQIHGITEQHIIHAPTFLDIYEEIADFIQNDVLVCHTHFDRTAWNKSVINYELPAKPLVWLDSARVTRRTWKQYAKSGYGLSNVCKDLGIIFKHHDALEDAKAAGLVLIKACQETGLNIDDWLQRVEQPIDPYYQTSHKREGCPDGTLYGETVVFTGTLSVPRREAADLAAAAGCNVAEGVTKNTTLLIVGDQDIKKLMPGHTKSSKHLKAEKLIKKGHDIRILQESDFLHIIDAK